MRWVLCCLALVWAPGLWSGEQVRVKGGTTLVVELVQNLSSKYSKAGDRVLFRVAEDVVIDGKTVIQTGALAYGRVKAIEKRGNIGKGGELSFSVRNVTAVDGQMLSLVRDNLGAEGRQRTGTTVAQTIIWGPIGLLTKGRHAVAIKGTEYEIEVRNEEHVDIGKSLAPPVLLEAEGTFSGSTLKKTIRVNLLKAMDRGKSFDLLLDAPSTAKDVRIVQINDVLLPDVLPTIGKTQKRGKIVFMFNFWDVAKFMKPGVNTLLVHADAEDAVIEAEVTFPTKWREK